MDVTVRVMLLGHEIDVITRPLRLDKGIPSVTYRKSLWAIKDDCIHIDREDTVLGSTRNTPTDNWADLLARVLPTHLPADPEECFELLDTCFRKNLPNGITSAISSLTATGLESVARGLLIDFLREHHDSERLSKLIQMQLIFNERTSAPILSLGANSPSTGFTTTACSLNEEKVSEWDWTSLDDGKKPDVDDHALRSMAEKIQETIAGYRINERGATVLDLDSPLNESEWAELSQGQHSPREQKLLERTANLGGIALDLLKYFADNPGDRPIHAELVLGYPLTDINKLVSGSLNQYLKRDQFGGWECQPWTLRVLSALDERL